MNPPDLRARDLLATALLVLAATCGLASAAAFVVVLFYIAAHLLGLT